MLDDIAAERWNALATDAIRDPFYVSWPWLRYVEEDRGHQKTQCVTLTRDGELRGAVPLYEPEGASSGYDLGRILPGLDDRSRLLAGSQRAYKNVALARSPEDRGLLIASAEEYARDTGYDGLAFLYLDEQGAAELASADARVKPLLLGADCTLTLAGTSFADYLASLPQKPRGNVRRERRAFEDAGYEVAVEPLADCVDEAAPLVANLQQRYGHAESVESCRKTLSGQAKLLGDYASAFTARIDGKLVGFCLCYRWLDGFYLRVAGFDYPSLRGAFEYFNLVYYMVIDAAYASDVNFLHFGRGSYAAKVARGAEPRSQWAVLIGGTDHIAWRDWNREALARWRSEPGLEGLTAPQEWR